MILVFNEHIRDALNFIRVHRQMVPKTAIILGSGLGNFADLLEHRVTFRTGDIPHYPQSTVEGHSGNLVFGNLQDTMVLAVQGRTHFYEGHELSEVVFVVRLIAALGIRLLIVTNASGAVNPQFIPGDLMLIRDHINYMFRNPLRGGPVEGKERFPDMSNPYNTELIPQIDQVAAAEGISLKKGVLLASAGPTYETAAEIRMIRGLKADAVSMSTIPEVIVAKQEGLKVIGISCITNMATGLNQNPLDHDEVTRIAGNVNDSFVRLVSGIIRSVKQ